MKVHLLLLVLYFEVFLSNDILDIVASETNEYHKMSVEANPPSQYSSLHKWFETSVKELYIFIAVTLTMLRNKL